MFGELTRGAATRRRGRVPVALAVTLSLVASGLQGCAGSGLPGSQSISVDNSDVCRAERAQLRSVEDFFSRAIVQGAAAGALTGATAGGLLGGDIEGALTGAAAGAVVGGITGYWLARQQASSDTTTLVQNVYGDLSTENQQIDRTTASFRAVRDCRFNEAKTIKADFAAGKITREDATQRLATVKSRFNEELGYAESLGAKIGQRGGEFDYASNEVLKLDPNAQQTLAQRRAEEAAAVPTPVFLVAKSATKVRSSPANKAEQVASLAKGDAVLVVGEADGNWTQVKLDDGTEGYMPRKQLETSAEAKARAAKAAEAARKARAANKPPPPRDAAGVAELTESNQLKRKALGDEVGQAKAVAFSAFDLDKPISALPAKISVG
jgi:outer membrane lipoprotein SlyB/SH3-like domain-containing protein